jgi:superfamily II DNA or RNA helicase
MTRQSGLFRSRVQFLHARRAVRMVDQQSLQAGNVVVIRRQRWRIVSIRAYPRCKVLALTGAGIVNAGRPLHLIAPFDDVQATARARIRLATRRSWSRRCRALLAAHGPSDRLQIALHARIDLMAHQLEPALAVVRGVACRVLIADEVGLGKTIQAGLIAAELRERGMADRILVIAPSGLREQWAGELRDRFKLDATIMDASSVRKRSSMLAAGLNPWTTVATAITSFDYAKRAEVLPAVSSCRWDLVIVDEAHGAGPGSDRLAALRAVSSQTTYVVLVTATPHNGSRAAFEALCTIGGHGDRLLIFRRTREAVALTSGRHVHRLAVAPSPHERELHAKLANLARAIADEPQPSRDAWLTVGVFQKRAFSSAYAIAQSVGRRLGTIDHAADHNLALQLLLPLGDAGELEPADDAPALLSPVLRDAAIERRLLSEIAAHAAAAGRAETKLSCLARLLRRLGRLGEPAIVFTEYRDTLVHVRRHLACDCALLHGGLSAKDRRTELDKFRSGRCRVLLATDAAGEGLNLQGRCRVVVNLELPWNPMRLEQRIGRVDRIGQARRVHAFHLIAAGTGERRILEHLKARLTRARTDLAISDPLGFVDVDETELARIAGGIGDAHELTVSGGHQRMDDDHFLGHLEPEAESELRRLLFARQFSSDGAPGVEAECLATAARRSSTRAGLNGRTLAVVLSELKDGCGRPIAVQVLPLLAALVRRNIKRELRGLAAAIREQAALFDDGRWFRAMAELHEAFVDARRRRDAAILRHVERRPSALAQPGLFDRRAVRQAEADARHDVELRAELEGSLAPTGPPAQIRHTALLMAARW